MTSSLTAVTDSLFKLNTELLSSSLDKKKKLKLTSLDELKLLQETDDIYRKRKMPELTTNLDEANNQQLLKYWNDKILYQIDIESKNDNVLQNRQELLSLLNHSTTSIKEQSVLIEAKEKPQNNSASDVRFRGSMFRGVSKNKSKFQVYTLLYHLFHR